MRRLLLGLLFLPLLGACGGSEVASPSPQEPQGPIIRSNASGAPLRASATEETSSADGETSYDSVLKASSDVHQVASTSTQPVGKVITPTEVDPAVRAQAEAAFKADVQQSAIAVAPSPAATSATASDGSAMLRDPSREITDLTASPTIQGETASSSPSGEPVGRVVQPRTIPEEEMMQMRAGMGIDTPVAASSEAPALTAEKELSTQPMQMVSSESVPVDSSTRQPSSTAPVASTPSAATPAPVASASAPATGDCQEVYTYAPGMYMVDLAVGKQVYLDPLQRDFPLFCDPEAARQSLARDNAHGGSKEEWMVYILYGTW